MSDDATVCQFRSCVNSANSNYPNNQILVEIFCCCCCASCRHEKTENYSQTASNHTEWFMTRFTFRWYIRVGLLRLKLWIALFIINCGRIFCFCFTAACLMMSGLAIRVGHGVLNHPVYIYLKLETHHLVGGSVALSTELYLCKF